MKPLMERIARLSPEKQALLAQKLTERRALASESAAEKTKITIPRLTDRTQAPVSSTQQQFWFIDQLDPGSHHYLIPAAVRFEGPLQIEALKRSLAEIVRRHDILRTHFGLVDHAPVQQIDAFQSFDLPIRDLSTLSEAERSVQVEKAIRENTLTNFNISTGPLFKASLLKIGRDDHILMICIHHIIADGWSISVLVREITTHYRTFSEPGNSTTISPLPDLPIQFADFAAWQRDWLQSASFKTQMEYWTNQLAGAPFVLDLSTDFPRPAFQGHSGAHIPLQLPDSLVQALRSFSQGERATLFMTFLAAFQVLIYRYSGQEDFCIGTPVANRGLPELDGMIGPLVNSLVIRADLSGNPTFRETLARVRKTCLDAYTSPDLPFEILVEALQVERSLSYSPIFQVMFALQNAPIHDLQLDSLKIQQIETENGLAKFDLVFMVTEDEQHFGGYLEYSTDLFEPATIQRMIDHFLLLLKAAIANPDLPVSNLPLLTTAERQQILGEWNATDQGYFQGCAHQLFESWVEHSPDAPALIHEGKQLTYQQLNRLANQLARRLQFLGVVPETRVGVLCQRSFDLIIAILGVLKAGAAYLPLDPTYPEDRLNFMLADSEAPVLVTQPALREVLPEYAGQVVCIDEDLDIEPDENLVCNANADNLVYVIYTSGSTGRPKGTLLTHRGLCSLIEYQRTSYLLQPGNRVLQFSSASFDASVWDIFMALANGGTLVIPTQELLSSGPDLVNFMREQEINTAIIMPSVLSILPPADLPALHTLFVGAEVCPTALVTTWAPGRRFYNLYGPTETTIVATCATCDPNNPLPPPIGKAVSNTRLYVLDAQRQLLPVGIPGELYIGGVGVARGYLNRPELTAERFLPDPFSSTPGARMYKTGDRVRWMADGNLEFLGRLDNQVKIRGFRIELGEIETALLDHPAVQQTVVLVQNQIVQAGVPGSRSLVAYLVLDPAGGKVTASALREYLKARLPEYMVPQLFAVLEKMPLTSNAKINRKALPAPQDATLLETTGNSESADPQTPFEEIISGIWTQVTGKKDTRSSDHFFEIGGNSLSAVQVISRVNALFHTNLPVRVLFEQPILHAFTQRVEAALRQAPELPLSNIPITGQNGSVPLSFAQQRLWFLDELEPGNPAYNIALGARLRGSLNTQALQHSLTEITRRHDVLRTSIQSDQGNGVQVVEESVALEIQIIDLTHLPIEADREKEALSQMQNEARRPFDLSKAPLMRAVLYRLETDQHLLLVTIHHIVSDGWSTGVMLREMSELYQAYIQDIPAKLPELSIQYGDYAVWQREWLQGQELEEQMGYWKQQLAALPPQLDLPTDFPRPALQTNHGATLAFPIDPTLAAEIKHFAQQEGVTLFMTLLAAFQTLLYRITQQDDFAVGTPIANRSRAELENLIGFFINTLVLRADLSGEPSFRQLLARVRETCLGAYTHQDLPFETLVDALKVERNLNHNPLFQVMLALHTANDIPDQPFAGLETEWMNLDLGTATFDITLIIQETFDRVTGIFEYNTDLYEPERIARMAEHFTLLLSAALSQPDLPISRLPMLSAQERQAVLFAFNDTARLDPRLALPIPTLFEHQVERCPDALALLAPADGTSLSYAQLNTLANQLAHALLRMQLPADAVVAVCLDRSPAAIACLLACLKTGLTFLPLDPSMPPQRLRFLLDDAQAALLITRPDTHLRLAPLPFPVLFIPHNDPWPWQALPVHNPALPLPADSLAYLLYTSGSTGQPKGVLVEQRALLNHNLAAARLFDLQPTDRLLQFASLAFDTALEEILPTLLHGATLVLRPDNLLPDAQLLNEWIAGWQLSVLDLPTAYWHAWVAALQQHPQPLPACLRLVVVGGEAAHPQALAAFQRLAGTRVTFLNTYGPTEAAIIATAYQPPCPFQLPALPIGRPIDNARVYLLDAHHQPVPIGCPGELYIAGAGVARGYLHRPELTDQRFLPDPFYPGQRMYQTGDRACWRSDGQLLFLGRLDNQLKLRGFRVEPGEIESWLSSHPLVAEAAVLPWQAPNGATLLVAYLVTAPQQPAPSLATLRDFLAQHLPDFMLPAALVCLPALPHTTTGKLDRAALPPPVFDAPSSTAPLPLTPVEQRLAQLWAELLARPGVSREDNFFALGGDSILSLQLVARAAQAGLHLTPRMLFEHPRLADLAAQLADAPLAPAIPQQPDSGAYPLTPIQQWFFRLNLAHPQHWNQSLLLALPQPPDPAHLQRILQALIDHHDLLRCAFTPDAGGAWTALVLPPGLPMPALDFVDLAQRPAEQQDAAMTAACSQLQAGFHLDRPPLLAARLFWLGAARGARLLLVAHHLVVDGISWRILLDDLRLALHQPAAQPILFPPRTVAFRAWAEALPALARSETLLAELPFWTSLPASAPLPCDGRPQHNQERAAQTRSLHLDGAATQTLLLHSAPALHATLEQLLLGALGWGLRQWAGPRAYTIELEHHGRSNLPALDVSRTVGWFTAAFPLGLELSAVADPLEALRQVKSSLHRLPNQGFGFGLLAAFHPDPLLRQQLWSLATPPISFNFLGQFENGRAEEQETITSESHGFERNPNEQRSRLLDITGAVISGQLELSIVYHPGVHSPATIERLANSISDALQIYMNQDGILHSEQLIPADFTDVVLSQDELSNLLDEINLEDINLPIID